ncbi:MAG: hypothetical protein KJN62_08270, partial [Deltaproteobacteria bacterium]|nr:hypothetical protein [Deltaproteobacteria bacterium]
NQGISTDSRYTSSFMLRGTVALDIPSLLIDTRQRFAYIEPKLSNFLRERDDHGKKNNLRRSDRR